MGIVHPEQRELCAELNHHLHDLWLFSLLHVKIEVKSETNMHTVVLERVDLFLYCFCYSQFFSFFLIILWCVDVGIFLYFLTILKTGPKFVHILYLLFIVVDVLISCFPQRLLEVALFLVGWGYLSWEPQRFNCWRWK